MAVIQSAGRATTAAAQSGIRPFELARDLRPVAELISDAFALELDERGAAALREMRMMSRVGGLLGVLNMAGSDFNDFFGGYVWVEEGKVVGNITVQRADKHGTRWQIANVAIAKEYRGRGLSRRLMDQAIRHIREQGGKWAVLQVYAENHVARTLYDHMGFESLGGIMELKAARAARVAAPQDSTLEPFSSGQWQPLYDLANSQLGAGAQWWRSLRRSDYEMTFEQQTGEWAWELLGRRRILRRCVRTGSHFEAAMVVTAQRWKGPHKLQLWVRPSHYGQKEQPLIQWALHALNDYPAWPVTISISTDHDAARDLLSQAGFMVQRTLLTLRLAVSTL
jgi:ribosomal protein S18 acetylase RimI-like enzyme